MTRNDVLVKVRIRQRTEALMVAAQQLHRTGHAHGQIAKLLELTPSTVGRLLVMWERCWGAPRLGGPASSANMQATLKALRITLGRM